MDRSVRSYKRQVCVLAILWFVLWIFSPGPYGGSRLSHALAPTPTGANALTVIGVPPADHLYHGVFPGSATGESEVISQDDLQAYEDAVGKAPVWVYFSQEWFNGRAFPFKTASWIRDAGHIPFIRLMIRSDSQQDHAEPLFTLARILNGDFDDDLRAWAKAARDFGTPLLVEYGTEMNGRWVPWNGLWNGGPDGPERFKDTYRHIIQISREAGASNITWVFHANNQDIPDDSWNHLEQYYPGDEWIDWIGVSVYGAQTPMETEWPAFRALMDAVYPRLETLSPSKPIVLLEFGVTARNPHGDQAAWARAALTDLIARRWPRLIGFSWWNEAWPNDDNPAHNTNMRVQDNPKLAAVFRNLVGQRDTVLSKAVFGPAGK